MDTSSWSPLEEQRGAVWCGWGSAGCISAALPQDASLAGLCAPLLPVAGPRHCLPLGAVWAKVLSITHVQGGKEPQEAHEQPWQSQDWALYQ